MTCVSHPNVAATWTCTQCSRSYCDACAGSAGLSEKDAPFCRFCGHRCVRVGQKRKGDSFWGRLPLVLVFPLRGGGLLTVLWFTIVFCVLLFLWAVAMVPIGIFLARIMGTLAAPIAVLVIGILGLLVIFGYVCRYLLAVVATSAAGSNTPPRHDEVSEDSPLASLWRFLVPLLISFGPVVVYAVWLAPHPGPAEWGSWLLLRRVALTTVCLYLAGSFYFPMALLGVAVSGDPSAAGPLRVARSILATPVRYAVTWLVFTVLVIFIREAVALLVLPVFISAKSAALETGVIWAVLITVLSLYCWTAGMHLLGVFYRTGNPKLRSVLTARRRSSLVPAAAALAITAIAVPFVFPELRDREKGRQQWEFVTKWGSQGSGNGQFNSPNGIAVDSSGNVYVADGGNNRIQKFDSDGRLILKWGSAGSRIRFGNGQFAFPVGVAVSPRGNVFVAGGHWWIQKFDSWGRFILKWGSFGTGDGQFNDLAHAVAVDRWGAVYVADTKNHRIQKFNSLGRFILKWGSKGSGDGEFKHPLDVAVDSSGNVYVADFLNKRIQKFDASGRFLAKWGREGSRNGEFTGPWAIAVDSSGNVYVADRGNCRIQKFDSDGKFLTKWGSEGSGDAEFKDPGGIAVDSSGNVFVVDSGNSRVQKFRRRR